MFLFYTYLLATSICVERLENCYAIFQQTTCDLGLTFGRVVEITCFWAVGTCEVGISGTKYRLVMLELQN